MLGDPLVVQCIKKSDYRGLRMGGGGGVFCLLDKIGHAMGQGVGGSGQKEEKVGWKHKEKWCHVKAPFTCFQ